MLRKSIMFILCACVVLGASQAADNLPLLNQLPSEVLFKDNEELVIECALGKEQGVSYHWSINGLPFTPNSEVVQRDNEGTLVIKYPNKAHEGKYQCLAETKHGVSMTAVSLRRTYIDMPPTVEVKKHKPIEGRMYRLDCKIPNSYPKPEIVWLYTSIADPSASRNILDRRITVSPEGDMYFSNVTKEDTSEKFKYVCVARTPAASGDVVLAEHVLEDVTPDDGPEDNEVYPQYASLDFTAVSGSVTMIYCIYGGTPLAHPDWYKDGRNVNNSPKDRVTRYNRSSGKRLLIKETRLEDEGTYMCIVDNGVGGVKHHTMHLGVVSVPEFTAQPEQKLTVQPGTDITVPCQIEGVPAPRVTWTFNAKDLVKTDRIHVERSSEGNSTVAVLTIKNAQGTDAGIYGCKGENFNGEAYSETLLVVK